MESRHQIAEPAQTGLRSDGSGRKLRDRSGAGKFRYLREEFWRCMDSLAVVKAVRSKNAGERAFAPEFTQEKKDLGRAAAHGGFVDRAHPAGGLWQLTR